MDLNELSEQAYICASRRGKVCDFTSLDEQIKVIQGELEELKLATAHTSRVIPPFTHRDEEAADVIIATLTLFTMMGTNVDGVIRAKMDYNTKR